jgi:diguanylate cyclase (GGDEF)-like protein
MAQLTELISTDPKIFFVFTGCLIALVFFLIGKVSGSVYEKGLREQEQKDHEKKLSISESGRNDLKRQLEEMKKQHDKYVYFVVRIPETVKYLNSTLTLDETISSIVRVTKDLIDTDCIELYLHDEKTGQLCLEAAYGSSRKEAVKISMGDGIIGKAGELNLMMTRDLAASAQKNGDGQLMHAAPMISRGKLIGVLGLGRIKNPTGDEKRIIAMITDLAAVSLINCEQISSAKEEANTDALTRLYNRKYFAERSIEEAQKAISYNFPISIFMFDIDHFKKYNDQNGHAEGDYLLKELSSMLKKNSRGRDVVARYGGEEFIVMLPNTDKKGAALYAEKIREMIETAGFRHREKQPLGFVSISGGIATFPADADTVEATIKLADQALYRSKKAGRNSVTVFEHQRLT